MRLAPSAAALLIALPVAAASQSPVPLPPPPSERPGAVEPEWRLNARLGLGHWVDARLDEWQGDFSAGLGAEWRPAVFHVLRLDLSADRYRRTYVGVGVDPVSGAPVRAATNENLWGARLRYGHEVLHYLGAGRTSLELEAGAGYLRFDDAVAPGGAVPLGAGLRLARSFGGGFEAQLEAFEALAVGAKSPGAASAYGKLKAAVSYGAGFGWRLGGGDRAEVGYRGEALVLEHDTRILHLLALQLGIGL